MLQNFSREFYTNEQDVNYKNSKKISESAEINDNQVENKINFSSIIAKLFSAQNIIIYILTFMISMVGFGNNVSFLIAPFGLALAVAAISAGIPTILVYIASLLGTAIRFGANITLIYITSSILLLVMILIRKPAKDESVSEKMRLGGYLFISTFITQMTYIFFKGFYLYDVMQAFVMSISSYIFYKIFVNSIDVIAQYGIKKVFSVEEVVGASLLVAIAVSCLGSTSIFGFSIRNIICIFIVLILGWRNGILVGATSGITVGIVLGIIGNGDPVLIAAYAISGMFAGLLNRFGKIGVIAGFALGNIIVAYSANGGANNIIMFQEILIASIGLIALPKKTKINIEDIIPQMKLLPRLAEELKKVQIQY